MSISSEINRISQNVADSLNAVAAKGVTVPSGSTSDDLPDLIAAIPTGQFIDAITVLPTGGEHHSIIGVQVEPGADQASPKQINFIDYDGIILHSYDASDWETVTELPANPIHAGLVAQGWNWTKEQIDAQLADTPTQMIWVGQMYTTESGDTEVDVEFPSSARLSPTLTLAINGSVSVDWGDGSSNTVMTGTSTNTRYGAQHDYPAAGKYTIKIHLVSGSYRFYGSSAYTLLRHSATDQNRNKVYSDCVKAVRFSNDVTQIGATAFTWCTGLHTVTIPETVQTLGNNVFYNCYSLTAVTIPQGVTAIGTYCFAECRTLKWVSFPYTVTEIGSYAFRYCTALEYVTIPRGVTTVNTYTFESCYSFASVVLPSGVSSIDANAFGNCRTLAYYEAPSALTTIGASSFVACDSLATITVPASVTSIGSSAFSNCRGVAEYHIRGTTPPSLGTTAFQSITSDCVIYVPSSALATYKAATNWSAYSSYMQGE